LLLLLLSQSFGHRSVCLLSWALLSSSPSCEDKDGRMSDVCSRVQSYDAYFNIKAHQFTLTTQRRSGDQWLNQHTLNTWHGNTTGTSTTTTTYCGSRSTWQQGHITLRKSISSRWSTTNYPPDPISPAFNLGQSRHATTVANWTRWTIYNAADATQCPYNIPWTFKMLSLPTLRNIGRHLHSEKPSCSAFNNG
jgi:hypothetical protein